MNVETPEALVARTAAEFFDACGFALPAAYAATLARLIRERDFNANIHAEAEFERGYAHGRRAGAWP
jgi:hypothetical protein